MTDTLAYAALLVVAILIFALLLPRVAESLRARQFRREAKRFAHDPRVGDKAGYRVNGIEYRVGEVEKRMYVSGELQVILKFPTDSPFGVSVHRISSPVDQLRYFPPDTPLGIYRRVAEDVR
jgi:hypothetical protein